MATIKSSSLLKTGLLVAVFTFISRIFGLLRELCIASFFGTSLFADSINMALKLPNLFRRSFGEGALTAAFVPIYSSALLSNEREASNFANQIFVILTVVLICVTVICEIFMPQIVFICAPGFANNPEKFGLSIILCRITTPYLILISLSALFGGILNSNKHFTLFPIIPIILSIFIIIACFVPSLSKVEKSINVAISILAAGILQLLLMFWRAKKYEPKIFFYRKLDILPKTKIFLKNFLPEMISSSSTQLNLFISQGLGSFVPGAISILSYADRIYQFPLSIIGACFGTILLPSLSKLNQEQKYKEAITLQDRALKLGLFLSIGAMCGICFLAKPIIFVIYERGHFSSEDTIKTAETIGLFATGLPAYVITKILTPIFYARLDTKTPMKITLATISINCILNGIFVYMGFAHKGIALGTSISAWCNIAIIIFYFKIKKITIAESSLWVFAVNLLIPSLCMFLSIATTQALLVDYIYTKHSIMPILVLLTSVSIGGFTYICAAIMLKLVPAKEFYSLFKK